MRRLHLSLGLILFLPMVILLLGSTFAVFWLSYSSGRSATTQVSDRLRTMIADNVASAVNEFLQSPELLLKLNQSYLEKGLVKPDDRPALARLFLSQIRAYSHITYLSYGSAEGWYVGASRNPDTGEILLALCAKPGEAVKSYRVDRDDQPTDLVSQSEAFDPRQRQWYQSAQDNPQPSWYPVYKYALYQSLGTGISVGVRDGQGKLLGVVCSDVALRQVSGYLQTLPLGQSGLAAVVESDGALVATNFLAEPFRRTTKGIERLTAINSGNELMKQAWQILGNGIDASVKKDQSGSFVIQEPGNPSLVNWEHISDLGRKSLVAITILPAREYFEDFETSARQSLLTIVAIMAAAALLVFLFSRRLAQTIRKLGEHATKLANGELPAFSNSSPIKEIHVLTGKLSAMAVELANTRDRLEAAITESAAELRAVRNQLSFGAFNAAGIAHEVRGPIGNGLLAASNLGTRALEIQSAMAEKTLTQTKLSRFLEDCVESSDIIRNNLMHSAEIARGFQNILVDQLGEGKRTIQLQTYLEQILFNLKPLLKKEGIAVRCDWGPPVELTLDPGLLSHIMANLVSNTIAHAFGPGFARSKEIGLAVSQDADGIEIVFSDNGRGMSEAVLKQLFDPLFTTNRSGGNTGLGMSIIRRSIEQKTGGSIKVESAEGIGSRFIIRFPANKQQGR